MEFRRIRLGAGGVDPEDVLREMPLYADDKESLLVKRLREMNEEKNPEERIANDDSTANLNALQMQRRAARYGQCQQI